MVKSRLSRSLLILHPAVSVALASSAVFSRAGASNATSTMSFAETLCDGACSFFDNTLTYSCPGVSSSSLSDFVPCGCISDSATTWEGCSRCMLLNADNGTQAALIMADDQKRFDDFQASCATAGQPMQDINLKNVPYIDSPVYFTYERPHSVSDKSFPDYITAVCQKPDRITLDQCWVGETNWMYCPNSDVAGILVRVSTYMANLLLGIVLMYSPKEAATTVWAQLLTIYSLLASGIVAIAHGDLTRFHSEIIVMLVMSPLSSTLVVYAILGSWGRSHRLHPILSENRQHLLTRLIVLAYAIISLALVLFNGIANDSRFSPVPCAIMLKGVHAIWRNLLFIPYAGVLLIILTIVRDPRSAVGDLIGYVALMMPFIILVLFLIFAIVRRRHVIAKQSNLQNERWRIWVMWDVLRAEYPFLHFCGVFLIPMLYWVLVVEENVSGTPDNLLSISFGQMMAVFVVLPPLLQVVKMTPMAWWWFRNLSLIRRVFGAPKSAPPATEYLIDDPTQEKDRLVDPSMYPPTLEYHQLQPETTPRYLYATAGRG